jgi:hypothetical protein
VADPGIVDAALADMQAVFDRDPACDKYTQCLLYFKGFQAIQCHRIAHHLWDKGRKVREAGTTAAAAAGWQAGRWFVWCSSCNTVLPAWTPALIYPMMRLY